MTSRLSIFGFANWWIRSKLGKKEPLVTTMFLFYRCNLRCRHCTIMQMLTEHPENDISISFDDAVKDMKERFDQGARIVYFEGGETTLWRDGDRDLGDLIDAAHGIGFYNVGYTTNGTSGKIFTNSDVISYSIDGTQATHDFVRGPGTYSKLMDTIANVDFKGAMYANSVLQKGNLGTIEDTARDIRNNPRLSGIVFNFLVPPPYDNCPTHEERLKAISEIRRLKKEGYPILNSWKGLELLEQEDWSEKCPYTMSVFTLPDGSHKNGCQLEGTESCKRCGYSAVREYYLIKKGNLRTIFSMAGVFAMGKRK